MVSYTNWSLNVTPSPAGLFQYANIVTNDLFVIMFLGSAWAIMFISMRGDNAKSAFVSTFVTFIMGALLWPVGVTPLWLLATLIVATMGSFMYVVYFSQKNEML